jgi:hypothetical protein
VNGHLFEYEPPEVVSKTLTFVEGLIGREALNHTLTVRHATNNRQKPRELVLELRMQVPD